MKIFLAALFALIILTFGAMCSAPGNSMLSTITIGSARINFTVAGGRLDVPQADITEWVRAAAESVATYYGRYPLEQVTIRIAPFDGRGVRNGRTFGENGGFISIHLGNETMPSALKSDWMMTHEMIHLAFPSVADRHHWIEEGISTYVEPIARVRAKHMGEAAMWSELMRDLPQGLPAEGDKGLDHTHSWGRTYWGGALYCFLADVEIHRRTNNRKGLEDTLRGILNAGGDIRREWELEKALSVGDDATGVPVLRPLYDKMKDQPYPVDLGELWAELGVERNGNGVRFVDSAPLAATRKAITWGTSGTASADSADAASGRAAAQQYPAVVAGRTARVR
jgi:hypothetical protein